MQTKSLKASEVVKKWYVVDAEGLILGRLASRLAMILRGKHKPTYTPHIDCGDNIIVINADKIALTGKKAEKDLYHWHTGYPGGIKTRTKGEILGGRFPERLLQLAVDRMLPEGPLARRQLTNLKIYAGNK